MNVVQKWLGHAQASNDKFYIEENNEEKYEEIIDDREESPSKFLEPADFEYGVDESDFYEEEDRSIDYGYGERTCVCVKKRETKPYSDKPYLKKREFLFLYNPASSFSRVFPDVSTPPLRGVYT